MAEPNSFPSDGRKPSLPEYPRNQAYTLMRLTSWLLMVGVVAHVIHMRFVEYPSKVQVGGQTLYTNVVGVDSGLYTLAKRLDVELYDPQRIAHEVQLAHGESAALLWEGSGSKPFDAHRQQELVAAQQSAQEQQWVKALQARPVAADQVVAVAKDFGTITLLIVRETFKSPFMVALYSLFVLIACYHAFNGLWTFLITWGVTITDRAQRVALWVSTLLMIGVAFLGLAAAIGTYWINLRY